MNDSADAPAGDDEQSGPDVHDLDQRIEEASERPTSGEDLSEEEKRHLEEERDERLDPDNRPDNVEVDNTDRDFDPVAGRFTDSEEDPDVGPFKDPESETG
jgi:hypothetical protein